MQTLTVNIQDNFVQDFLTILEHYKDKVQLQKNENLEHDPFFYERQKQLEQDLQEVENGTAEMISHSDLWNNINSHIKTLS
ncbi:MAG TPA: hypothetical protein CFH82_06605 [Sulfurospirillum sp. UBA12182]|jgi:hypothetical protein|nr:MAG TPA: hypothetical protein CFH82_06605 [Sulfurospirillum sp. UBA12182]